MSGCGFRKDRSFTFRSFFDENKYINGSRRRKKWARSALKAVEKAYEGVLMLILSDPRTTPNDIPLYFL